MDWTRRSFVAAAGATSLAGCTDFIGGGDGGNGSSPVDTSSAPEGTVTDAPIPDDPSSFTYATMGTDGPLVTYFANWKCPGCAQFSTGEGDVLGLGRIVQDYVSSGDVQLECRAFTYTSEGEPFLGADAPRAARAGLAVWNVDPQSYWRFHEQVMANQPPKGEKWATTDKLVEFAEQSEVENVEQVRSAVENGKYEDPVRANTDAATGYDGFNGTPSLVIDGAVYNPFDPKKTKDALDQLTGN